MFKLTRRALLRAAPASALAIALPASAVAAVLPAVAEAKPETKGDQLQRFLDTASPDDLLQYHASQIAKALCQLKPGLWSFNLDHVEDRGNFVLFTHTEHPTFVGYVQEFH